MKKFLLAKCLVVLALILSCGAPGVLAQRGPGPNRAPGQGGIARPKKQINPQLGGARNRLPGVKRPPLVDPQFGRLPNPNKARPLQLQRQRLMEAIGLTNDQRMRMGEIARSQEDEAISIGRRVRLARNGLDRAIMSPNYDEAQVRRYTEELAAAQADQIRFQSRMRAQMRGVLTSEQVIRLLQLEQEQRRQMREEKRDPDKESGEQQSAGALGPHLPLEEVDLFTLLLFAR